MLLLRQGVGPEAVYRQARRILDAQPLPEVSRRELAAVLEASRPGTLAFSHEAGLEAGLGGNALLTRAAAIYFLFCAVSVGDDLSDGDCTYLPDARRSGPCVQSILRNLFYSVILDAGLPPAALADAVRDLIAAAAAQRLEIATETWTAPVFRTVADGIGGRLFSAYLRVLWCGTRLEPRAPAVGQGIGRAVVVWEDAGSADRRFTSMPLGDRQEVSAWALDAVAQLHAEGLRSVELLLRPIEPALRRLATALAQEPASSGPAPTSG